MRVYSSDSVVPRVGVELAFEVVLRPSLVLFSVSTLIRPLFLFSWSASAEVACGLQLLAPSLSSIPCLVRHHPDQRNGHFFLRIPSTLRNFLFQSREDPYSFLSLAFALLDLFVLAFEVLVGRHHHFEMDCGAVVELEPSFAGLVVEVVDSSEPEIASSRWVSRRTSGNISCVTLFPRHVA